MKKIILLFALSLPVFIADAKEPPVYTKAEILGDVDPSSNKGFDKIKSKYTTKSGIYLRDEVYDAFKDMWKDAKKDGVNLVIISAMRNRNYQAGIWNRKWKNYGGDVSDRAERILQYSSMPGTSRHHWGTDFDLNSLENSYFESGEGKKIYEWLSANAHKYGFFQPYTLFDDYRDAGYREEKWHWSYYPTASKFQRAYNHIVKYDDIKGFDGSEYAPTLDVINNYVNGIETPPYFSEQ
ncbi:M15 family metallopeptidase [Owenweeksia hongkongensis]|uniref:M15 family metallopeptidase n=1 Tax=Owenweeksia hongkongensis TaxID=253245 RepID=UPI003A8FC7DF